MVPAADLVTGTYFSQQMQHTEIERTLTNEKGQGKYETTEFYHHYDR
jgi:hypothetical protein